MAYDINDWEITSLSEIKFSPIDYGQQRIKDVDLETQTIEVVKTGTNITATKIGYYNGTEWIHYFSSDGDAQLRWNNQEHQVVKDEKYQINLSRMNKTVEIDFHLELSTPDNPRFKLYDSSNNLIATLNLINSGNTSTVSGFIRFKKLPNGNTANAVYTYIKNGTHYHENQSAFFATAIDKVSFSADNGYSYTTNSYCIITNK